jgi:hypothetical protein
MPRVEKPLLFVAMLEIPFGRSAASGRLITKIFKAVSKLAGEPLREAPEKSLRCILT